MQWDFITAMAKLSKVKMAEYSTNKIKLYWNGFELMDFLLDNFFDQ